MGSSPGAERRRAARRTCVLLGCVWILWPGLGIAQAQPSEADKEVARGMMEKGDASYDAGSYAAALESYRKADSIVGVPTTGLAVARALERLGRLREAREVASRVAASKPVAGEPYLLTDARNRAAALARDLDRSIPTLQIVVTGSPQTARISLSIDGVEVPIESSVPVPLDPGEHAYGIVAEGFHPIEERLTLDRNERRRVEHVLVPAAAPPRERPARSSSAPALAYAGFGVGAAGVLAGATTGILSLSRAASAKRMCDGTECWPEARSDADSSKKLATASNIAFGVGLVGLGVGIVGLLTSSPARADKHDAGFRLQVTPLHSGAGLRVVRSF